MPIFCPSCGTANSEVSHNCQSCSAPLPVARQPESYPQYDPYGRPQNYPQQYPPQQQYQQQPIPMAVPMMPVVPIVPVFVRPPVNSGVALLLSFLWTGAGFFMIPDRIGLGIALVIGLPIIVFGLVL